MNKNEEYKKFRENMKTIIKEEILSELKDFGVYRTYSGVVVDIHQNQDTNDTNPFNQTCSVDLVFTQVRDLLNKSGQFLKNGDTVVVFEKIGSNLSNCFVAYKNN